MGRAVRSMVAGMALVASALAGIGSPAAAGPIPPTRISGAFVVPLKVTDSEGSGAPVGSSIRRVYTFRPTCSKGACGTEVTSAAGTGGAYHVVLGPTNQDPNWYVGSINVQTDCRNDAGVIVHPPLGLTFEVRVTKRDRAGNALALTLRFRSSVIPHGAKCTPGSETGEGTSVRGTEQECKALAPTASGPYTLSNPLGGTVRHSLPASSPRRSPLTWRIVDKSFPAAPNALRWDGQGGFAVKPAARGAISLHYTVTDVAGCSAKPKAIRITTH